jgi:hypothetical protein
MAAPIIYNEAVAHGKKVCGEVSIASGSRDQAFLEEKHITLRNSKGEDTEFLQWEGVTGEWKESNDRKNLWRAINQCRNHLTSIQSKVELNAADGPSAAELRDLIGYLYIDMQRLTFDLVNIVPRIANVINAPNATKTTRLRELLPFSGRFLPNSGQNDAVPLMDTPNLKADIDLIIRGIGWKGSLFRDLYMPIDDLMRATETAAIAYVDSMNNDIVFPILKNTDDTDRVYPPTQSVDADATANTSAEEKLYKTLKKAIAALGKLKNPVSGKVLAGTSAFTGNLALLCNPGDALSLQQAIAGYTVVGGGVATTRVALQIGEIIPYGGGIMDAWTWGKDIINLPGIPPQTAFLFMKGGFGAQYLIKRTLTMESGYSSVLTLSREERAWYYVAGAFMDWLLGGAATGGTAGTGMIVKVNLPNLLA